MLRRRHALAAALCTSAAAALADAAVVRPLLAATTSLPYRGVLVDLAEASATATAARASFDTDLAACLEEWQTQGLKSCMIKVPIEHAGLATIASEHGFEFHHVSPTAPHHVLLKRWLQPTLSDKMPPYATHQVGIAGLVCKGNQLLVVKEWRDDPSGPLGARVPSAQWKLPGGLVERGESFESAVCREVFEECGVHTRFRSLLCFWHRHALTWGQSDLYYVARLEPTDDSPIVLQEDEISAARWMDVDEFRQTQDHPLIMQVLTKLYTDDGLDGSGEGGAESEAFSPLPLASPLVEMVE